MPATLLLLGWETAYHVAEHSGANWKDAKAASLSRPNFSPLSFSACLKTFPHAVLIPSNTCALQWRSCTDDSVWSISLLSMSNCRLKDFMTLARSVMVPRSVDSIATKFCWASSWPPTSDSSCSIVKLLSTRVVVFSTPAGHCPDRQLLQHCEALVDKGGCIFHTCWASSWPPTDSSCSIVKLLSTRVVVFSTLAGVKPALKTWLSVFTWWPTYFLPDLEVPSKCRSHASPSSRASDSCIFDKTCPLSAKRRAECVEGRSEFGTVAWNTWLATACITAPHLLGATSHSPVSITTQVTVLDLKWPLSSFSLRIGNYLGQLGLVLLAVGLGAVVSGVDTIQELASSGISHH